MLSGFDWLKYSAPALKLNLMRNTVLIGSVRSSFFPCRFTIVIDLNGSANFSDKSNFHPPFYFELSSLNFSPLYVYVDFDKIQLELSRTGRKRGKRESFSADVAGIMS